MNENAADEKEWLKWATRAYQATYGYEFQGDNLLIARVNLLMTYDDYLQERWKRKPTATELGKLINVIAWNIWQMDGLTGTIPYSKAQEQFRQMTLFDMFGGGLNLNRKTGSHYAGYMIGVQVTVWNLYH